MAQKPTPEAVIDNAAQGDDETLRNAAGVPPQGAEATQAGPAESSATAAAPADPPAQERDPNAPHAPNFEESLQAERNPQPRSSDDIAANVDGIGDLDGRELQSDDTAQPDEPEAAPPSQRV